MNAATSIIMPAYNVGPYIGDAINSVRAQTRDDWQLIIVDDGSVDNTAAVVEQFAADQRIRLIRQDNGGAPVARNRAIAEANTQFLSLLDADDSWVPDYLEQMLGALESDAELAFVSCDAFTFQDERIAGNRCSQNTPMVPPVTLERVAARDFQVYTAVSLRRSWFDRVGGYDDDLRNAQDFDLWLRLLGAGARAAYIDKPLAWYRRTPGSLSSDAIRISGFEIQVYEKLRRAHPELSRLCDDRVDAARYTIALNKAKQALRNKEYREFQDEAASALAIKQNPKLKAASWLAGLSPGFARAVLNWRS